jgi:GAF domain-containing protein
MSSAEDQTSPDWIALERTNENLHLQVARNRTLLAQVRAATTELIGARSRTEALDTALEIVANLFGCEDAAIFEIDGKELVSLRAVGERAERMTRVRIGEGAIGDSAERRIPVYSEGGVLAAVPLLAGGRVRGVLALFRLLPQKTELGQTDRDLLETVAGLCGLVLCALREEGAGA